jgi:plasmid maintenance system killer protein
MEEEMEELYAEGLATNGGPKRPGDRAGQYSIRINRQWRICFRWTDAGPEDVEITDYY